MTKLATAMFLFLLTLSACTQKNKEDSKGSDSVEMAGEATATDIPEDATATSMSEDTTQTSEVPQG